MPRYKLRVPAPGTMLYGDGDNAIVADTIDQARGYDWMLDRAANDAKAEAQKLGMAA